MKTTALLTIALVTVFTTSSAFAGRDDGHRREYRGKGAYKSGLCESYGKGMRDGGMQGAKFYRELSAEEVKTLQKARLIYMNNPNIIIDDVVATDEGYKVTIVTKENRSLVEEFEVARNGMRLEHHEAMQKRIEARKAARSK